MQSIINTDDAPKAVGPYSQAILDGNLVFCSGQIGIDPKTGELVSYETIEQARQAITNLINVLVAAGSSKDKILKVDIFLTNMKDFEGVNKVYSELIGGSLPPARQTVGVASLPKKAKFEISCIAGVL
jgi:2-iminobutanoate/2-iminopropanoate deaminase